MAVTRRAIDRHAAVDQSLTTFIDVIDAIGEVTEIAALAITGFIPIMGQFHLRRFVTGCRQENQREPPRVAIKALKLAKAKQFKEGNRCDGIANADHGVEIFHVRRSTRFQGLATAPNWASAAAAALPGSLVGAS